LGGGIEHAPGAILRQVSERRLATPRPGERNIGAKRFRQDRGIDPNLRNVTVRFGPTEKFPIAFIDKNVEHSLFERRICCVTVQVPIPIHEIDFDAAAQRLAAVHANGGIAKIRACFAVPGAELDDVDLVTARADKISSELAGEPARLKFEFVRRAQRKEKGAFVNTGRSKQVFVAGGAVLHALIVIASLSEARFKS
jgi:hypothetical protein